MPDKSPTKKGASLRKAFFRHYHRPAHETFRIIGASRWECDRKKQATRSRIYKALAIGSAIAFFIFAILLLVSILR